VRIWLIAIFVCCCFGSVAAAQDAPGTKGNPQVNNQWNETVKSLQDAMPEPSSISDGLTGVIAEILWAAKMAVVGIIVVLALAVLGKIFTFMHK
jgi:hypothetical protein